MVVLMVLKTAVELDNTLTKNSPASSPQSVWADWEPLILVRMRWLISSRFHSFYLFILMITLSFSLSRNSFSLIFLIHWYTYRPVVSLFSLHLKVIILWKETFHCPFHTNRSSESYCNLITDILIEQHEHSFYLNFSIRSWKIQVEKLVYRENWLSYLYSSCLFLAKYYWIWKQSSLHPGLISCLHEPVWCHHHISGPLWKLVCSLPSTSKESCPTQWNYCCALW